MSTPKEKAPQKGGKKYLIFSSIALEMIVAIVGSAWVGKYLDAYFKHEKEVLTLTFMLMGVFVSILILIKRIKNI